MVNVRASMKDSAKRFYTCQGNEKECGTNQQKPPTKDFTMPSVTELIAGADELFLRLYTDRFSSLGPDYNPDLACPLTQEEIQSFKDHLNNISDQHGALGITQLTESFLSETSRFLSERIFPQISDHISNHHFPRSFSQFLRILAEVRHNLNDVLPEFPSRNDLVNAVFEHSTNEIYSNFGESLVEVVFIGLSEIRQEDNINEPETTLHLIDIARHFHRLQNEEEKWITPYYEKVKEHTAVYAGGLDTSATVTFVEQAFKRAHDEESFADSFNLGGLDGRKKTTRSVLDSFCEIYNNYAVGNQEISFNWLLQHESAETQAIFQSLLRLYGHAGEWDATCETLRTYIISTGQEIIGRLRVPSNNWSMDTLESAVRALARHEQRVYNRVRPSDNLTVPGLRRLLEREFKKIFRKMFRSNEGRKKPEEFLAEFVEYIVSRPEHGEIKEWQMKTFEYMNVILRHLRRKDRFINYLQRWIKIYEPNQANVHNNLFITFLNMPNVKNYVSESMFEQLYEAVSVVRISFAEVVKQKAMVLQMQSSNTPLVGNWEGLITNLTADSKLLYTVSVRNFCGSRASVYLRLTGCQLEVLNMMLVWSKLSMMEIYSHLIRDDISGNALNARESVNKVLKSLMAPISILEKDPHDLEFHNHDVVSLSDQLVFNVPYFEVALPVQGVVGLDTDPRFAVDRAIWEFLEGHTVCSIGDLLQYVLQVVFVHLDVFRERIKILEERGFLSRPSDQPNLVYYLSP